LMNNFMKGLLGFWKGLAVRADRGGALANSSIDILLTTAKT
jgi:hypothetical protein